MKLRVLPALAGLLGLVPAVHGSTNVNYTASADPNSNPDSNGNTVNVWTLTHSGDAAGASSNYYGSYYATGVGILGTAWAIYSNHNYTTATATSNATAATSEADQTATLPGGALSIGQTMSIDFLANSVDTYQQYGIRLTNTAASNTFVFSLSFIGGDGGYRYYDGATPSNNIALPYQGNGFRFSYTQTSATTYTFTASALGGGAVINSFTGTDGAGGAPNTIQIYNESAGVNSDGSGHNVLTNNFAIVPEPGSYVFLGAGMLGAVALLRRRRQLA